MSVTAPTNVRSLRCTGCAVEYVAEVRYHCDRCGFPLAVEYAARAPQVAQDASQAGLWRWHGTLPAVTPGHRISLGEGATTALAATNLAATLGIETLTLKIEGGNPTGSFKDRPTSLCISLALDFGADTVVVSSTGNAGAALAAYAARAGLRAVVVANAAASPSKLAPIAFHGAEIVVVDGTVSDAFAVAYEAAQHWGWFNLTSTFLNPYSVEGNKTVAYELWASLAAVPDVILVPVSVGPLLVGIQRGYAELRDAGAIDRVPRMVAVQAEGCSPLVQAFDVEAEHVEEWTGGLDTAAGGIADPLIGYASDATYALRTIRKTGGFAIACSEAEIASAHRALAQQEGVFAEPTAAVAVAGLRKALDGGRVEASEHAVCLLTGHGSKQPQAVNATAGVSPPIPPTLAALERALGAS